MTHSAPALQRSMKFLGALLITLSSLTPASSVFVIVPGIVQQAGTGAVVAFAAASLVSLLIAFVYAELSSAFPLTGGEYAITGRVLGPAAGFIIFGVNLLVLLLNITVVALGLADYLPQIPGLSHAWVAVISIVFTTLCALLSIRTNALVTGAFLSLELLSLVVLTVLGMLHPVRSLTTVIAHPVFLSGGHLLPVTLGAVGLAGSAAIFANYGFGNAVFLGEETHDAPRHIARAILWALAIGVLTQIIPLAAVLCSAPDLATSFASDTMFGDFVRDRGGIVLGDIIRASVALAIINCNIAFVILVARLLFSTGRDRVWPDTANRALLLISAHSGAPWVATLVTGFLAASLCFVPLSLLLVMTGTAIVAVYGAICISVVVGRITGSTAHAAYRMPFYPWPAVFGVLGLVYVVWANLNDPVSGRPSLMATVAAMVVSAGYYWLVLRRRGVWVLQDPVAESLQVEFVPEALGSAAPQTPRQRPAAFGNR